MINPTQYTPTDLAENLCKTVIMLMSYGRDRQHAIQDVANAWALTPAQIKLIDQLTKGEKL